MFSLSMILVFVDAAVRGIYKDRKNTDRVLSEEDHFHVLSPVSVFFISLSVNLFLNPLYASLRKAEYRNICVSVK